MEWMWAESFEEFSVKLEFLVEIPEWVVGWMIEANP